MQITLTAARLEELDACSSGVAVFREMFGEEGVADWTREKQIELLLSPLGKYLGWAVEAGLIPLWSMDGARLDGARLDGARLDGARLVDASLNGANLDGANLVGANLVDASLNGARLDGANLVGANLIGANLIGARLDGARLDGARLDGASLDGANLDGASFAGAKICACGQGGCVRLRDTLDAVGWVYGPDGLLMRKPAESGEAGTVTPDLLEAAKRVLADLNERIRIASERGVPVPVFGGIADLHAAIGRAEATP